MMRTRVVKIHLYEDDILWDIYIYDMKKKAYPIIITHI